MLLIIIANFVAKKLWPSRSMEELTHEEMKRTLELIEETERAQGLRA